MRKIYTSADQLIGKTPLLELVHTEQEQGPKVWRPGCWASWSTSTPPEA